MYHRLTSAAVKIQYSIRKHLMALHFYPTETEEFNQSQSELQDSIYAGDSKCSALDSARQQNEKKSNTKYKLEKKTITISSSQENV